MVNTEEERTTRGVSTRSVDRVLAALHHEEPDMVPVIEHFTTSEAQDRFVGDRLRGITDPWERKLFLARWWGNDIVSVGGNLPRMLQKTLVMGDNYRIEEQAYGSITYTRSRPYFHKVLHSPVRWPEDLDRIPVPDPEVVRPKIETIAREARWFKEKGYFVEAFHNGPFVMSWHWLRGLTQFCMDTVRNPSFAKRIVEFGMKPQIEVSKMIIDEAGVHAIRIGNDLGTTRSLLISPKAYRKIIHPWMERLVKTYHRRGVMIFHHCHGNINLIFEEMWTLASTASTPWIPTTALT